MDGRGRTFFLLQVFFCFFVFASTEKTKQDCSQVQCPGPLSYYHDVGCTPVYKNEGDCCAYKYNCDHLDDISINKCYIKNNSYEIGEYASQEDVNKCDMTCVCAATENSARFWCFYDRHDFTPPPYTNCYMKRNIHECGPATIICPKNKSDIPQCSVGGLIYEAGSTFETEKEPKKWCTCQEGYTGDNIESFCITPNQISAPENYDTKDIVNKHAPIYFDDQIPAVGPTEGWRRQNADDIVIPNPNGHSASEGNSSGEEDMTCKFGNLTMNIGDELNKHADPQSQCSKCICEVPPTPTCRYFGFHDDCNAPDDY